MHEIQLQKSLQGTCILSGAVISQIKHSCLYTCSLDFFGVPNSNKWKKAHQFVALIGGHMQKNPPRFTTWSRMSLVSSRERKPLLGVWWTLLPYFAKMDTWELSVSCIELILGQ